MVYEIKTYVDEVGKSVLVNTPVSVETGLPIDGKVEYSGHVAINTPRGPLPIQFPFPETTASLGECFENFEVVLKAFIKEQQDKAKSAIITPDQIISPN